MPHQPLTIPKSPGESGTLWTPSTPSAVLTGQLCRDPAQGITAATTLVPSSWLEIILCHPPVSSLLPAVFAESWKRLCRQPTYSWTCNSCWFFVSWQSVVTAHLCKKKLAAASFCGMSMALTAIWRACHVHLAIISPLVTGFDQFLEPTVKLFLWSKPLSDPVGKQMGIPWNRPASVTPVGSSCLANQYCAYWVHSK